MSDDRLISQRPVARASDGTQLQSSPQRIELRQATGEFETQEYNEIGDVINYGTFGDEDDMTASPEWIDFYREMRRQDERLQEQRDARDAEDRAAYRAGFNALRADIGNLRSDLSREISTVRDKVDAVTVDIARLQGQQEAVRNWLAVAISIAAVAVTVIIAVLNWVIL